MAIATYCWCAAYSWPICSLSWATKASEGMGGTAYGRDRLGGPKPAAMLRSPDDPARRSGPLQEEVLPLRQALQEVPGRLEEALAPGFRGARGQAQLRRGRDRAEARAQGRARLTLRFPVY